MKRISISLQTRHGLKGYLFILPFLFGFFFLFLVPLIQTALYSFSEVSVSGDGLILKFIGWENYRQAFFVDPVFLRLLVSSVVQLLTDVPVILVFSFCAALLLKKPFKGIGLVKSIFFLTVIFSSGVFMRMQADTMEINTAQAASASQSFALLQSFDMEAYLSNLGLQSGLAGYINSYVNNLFAVITRSGIQIFIFLAGITAIPDSLYEAGNIEGASGWEAFWKITLPMVSPMILVNMVYTVVDFFTSYLNATLNFITNEAFSSFHYGYASSLSWIYFLVIFAILGIAVLIISRRVFYQA